MSSGIPVWNPQSRDVSKGGFPNTQGGLGVSPHSKKKEVFGGLEPIYLTSVGESDPRLFTSLFRAGVVKINLLTALRSRKPGLFLEEAGAESR